MTDLAINGLGMISSLGHDVVTSCAALRAGMSRPSEISYFKVFDPETHAEVPLIGRPVSGFSEGFLGVAAWVRLALGALDDLIRQSGLPVGGDREFWSSTGLILVSCKITDERFGDGAEEALADLVDAFVEPFIDNARVPIQRENVTLLPEGHLGVTIGLQHAKNLIDQGQYRQVILVAVDTLLDPGSLTWLSETERLKDDEASHGIIPGEASVAILLGPAPPGSPKSLVITGLSVQIEELQEDQPPQGEALAAAITQVLQSGSGGGVFSGAVFSDFNGETRRAYELGTMRVRLSDTFGDGTLFEFPSESLGEVGAASSAVSVCAAARAWERGYAVSDSALVISSDGEGRCGAIRLEYNN